MFNNTCLKSVIRPIKPSLLSKTMREKLRKMRARHEATIPWVGMYETIFNSALDDELDQSFSDRDTGMVVNEELRDKAYDATDWHKACGDMAKLYCEAWAEWAKLDVKFQKMHSPPYYNYETDVIFVTISRKSLLKAYAGVDKDLLDKVARASLTSYDGFTSFYDPDYTTWPADVCEWDGIQIGTLLHAWSESISRTEEPFEGESGGDFEWSFDQWKQYELIESDIGDGAIYDILSANCPILGELLDIFEATQPEEGV